MPPFYLRWSLRDGLTRLKQEVFGKQCSPIQNWCLLEECCTEKKQIWVFEELKATIFMLYKSKMFGPATKSQFGWIVLELACFLDPSVDVIILGVTVKNYKWMLHSLEVNEMIRYNVTPCDPQWSWKDFFHKWVTWAGRSALYWQSVRVCLIFSRLKSSLSIENQCFWFGLLLFWMQFGMNLSIPKWLGVSGEKETQYTPQKISKEFSYDISMGIVVVSNLGGNLRFMGLHMNGSNTEIIRNIDISAEIVVPWTHELVVK